MDKRKNRPQASANEGIQADNVTADVMAVGHGAQAIKTVYGALEQQRMLSEIAALRRGLDALGLDPNARAVVEEDVSKLEEASKKEKPDPAEVEGLLQSIAGKLKMVGVILAETLALNQPLKQIAALVGASLKTLGLA